MSYVFSIHSLSLPSIHRNVDGVMNPHRSAKTTDSIHFLLGFITSINLMVHCIEISYGPRSGLGNNLFLVKAHQRYTPLPLLLWFVMGSIPQQFNMFGMWSFMWSFFSHINKCCMLTLTCFYVNPLINQLQLVITLHHTCNDLLYVLSSTREVRVAEQGNIGWNPMLW